MKARSTPVARPWRRTRLAAGLLAGMVGLTACDTLLVGKVEPALFPAAAASAPAQSGRAALVLPPAVRGRIVPGPGMCDVGRKHLQLPLGDIVDAALQRQLQAAFAGGVFPAALPLPASGDAEVALSVVEMRLSLDSKLNWMVPIPAPFPPFFIFPAASSYTVSARLELDLSVFDTLGRTLLRTTVDSGTVSVERGTYTMETGDRRCLKLAHQAAWLAGAQATKVLRETLQAERRRERAL